MSTNPRSISSLIAANTNSAHVSPLVTVHDMAKRPCERKCGGWYIRVLLQVGVALVG
jgi:hypothetical protein